MEVALSEIGNEPDQSSITGNRPASGSPFRSLLDEKDLQEENERLKAELEHIRKQLILLQNQQQQFTRPRSIATTASNLTDQPISPKTFQNSTHHESESLMRRRKDESSVRLSSKSTSIMLPAHQQVLHHRHFKSPRSSVQIASDHDCEHGMVEVDQSASLPTMPLLPNNTSSQQHSNLLADSMDPIHFYYQVQDRAQWLVGLLVLQSMSSFIIARNEAMLQKHLILVQFLTMLVGAGGNAGNQSSVRVIRGLATGQITNANVKSYLLTELKVACILCMILGTAGCVRTLLFFVPLPETVAITTSLCIIVLTSIILGALLPLAMRAINVDPAHSSTTIQVLMDIMGVTITVCVGSLILDSPIRQWFLWS